MLGLIILVGPRAGLLAAERADGGHGRRHAVLAASGSLRPRLVGIVADESGVPGGGRGVEGLQAEEALEGEAVPRDLAVKHAGVEERTARVTADGEDGRL